MDQASSDETSPQLVIGPASAARASGGPAAVDPALERWRLILGQPADSVVGGQLSATAVARDAALEWLYSRDAELGHRGVRGPARSGGTEDSVLTTVDWLDEITRLFPKETVERLERDAVDRYQVDDLLTDPRVLERVQPNPALLAAVLKTKHLMNPEVLALARKLVAAVVEDLIKRLATEVRQRSFSGSRLRRPSRHKQARNFDVQPHDPRESRALQPGGTKAAI